MSTTPGPLKRGPTRTAALVAGSAVIAWLVYLPALDGAFVSDDHFYVAANPYVHSLSLENLAEILDPRGAPVVTTLNYAPLHLLGHAIEYRLFGRAVRGYHVVNVALHVGVAWLCVAFAIRIGAAPLAALLGGLLFLVHPANAEAVAWIFQLKTIASTGLALGALLIARRRPALSTTLFGAALLTKVSAACALPALAALVWTESGARRPARRELLTLGAWAAVFVALAVPIWAAIDRTAIDAQVAEVPIAEVARMVPTVFARYAVMALTGTGLSTFHDPDLPGGWLDPFFLGGLLLIALAAWRTQVALARRDAEAAGWLLLAGAFFPVSQVLPLPYPLADRYLYTMLPGAIGVGALLLTRSVRERRTALAVGGAAAALSLFLAVVAHGRAGVFANDDTVNADAARHYPNGVQAHMIASREAAARGDAVATAGALRAAMARGHYAFGPVVSDPAYAAVRESREFDAVIREMAAWWIERGRTVVDPTQEQLHSFANAHYVRGELPESIALLERALDRGGPRSDVIARDLDARRLELRLQERLGRGSGRPR